MEHSQKLIPFLLSSADFNFPLPVFFSMDELTEFVNKIEFEWQVNIVSKIDVVNGVLVFLSEAGLIQTSRVNDKSISVNLTPKGICLLKRKVDIQDKPDAVIFRQLVRNFSRYDNEILGEAVENALVDLEMDWRR